MPRKSPPNNEWCEIMKGTNNGLYIVLIGLGWWAQGAQFAKLDMKAWNDASADVIWAINEMKHTAQDVRKRSHNNDEQNDSETNSQPNSKR